MAIRCAPDIMGRDYYRACDYADALVAGLNFPLQDEIAARIEGDEELADAIADEAATRVTADEGLADDIQALGASVTHDIEEIYGYGIEDIPEMSNDIETLTDTISEVFETLSENIAQVESDYQDADAGVSSGLGARIDATVSDISAMSTRVNGIEDYGVSTRNMVSINTENIADLQEDVADLINGVRIDAEIVDYASGEYTPGEGINITFCKVVRLHNMRLYWIQGTVTSTIAQGTLKTIKSNQWRNDDMQILGVASVMSANSPVVIAQAMGYNDGHVTIQPINGSYAAGTSIDVRIIGIHDGR